MPETGAPGRAQRVPGARVVLAFSYCATAETLP
jgi:hypothetical protein